MQPQLFPIACVVLASGSGTRFGSNKLLADFNGEPIVQHILHITNNLFAERVVVTRHAEIKKLCQMQTIPCLLHNEQYLSDTVRLGVQEILKTQLDANASNKLNAPQALQGLLFATSDQPFLQRASLVHLAASFLSAPTKIHRLYASDTPGNPIIFPLALADELQHLPQDKGGGVLVKKYPELVVRVPVQDKYELYDVDTQANLLTALHYAQAAK